MFRQGFMEKNEPELALRDSGTSTEYKGILMGKGTDKSRNGHVTGHPGEPLWVERGLP